MTRDQRPASKRNPPSRLNPASEKSKHLQGSSDVQPQMTASYGQRAACPGHVVPSLGFDAGHSARDASRPKLPPNPPVPVDVPPLPADPPLPPAVVVLLVEPPLPVLVPPDPLRPALPPVEGELLSSPPQ